MAAWPNAMNHGEDGMIRPSDITVLLQGCREGRRQVIDRLFSLVYEELHRMAHARMARERSDHTLQATALVHEAFERLVDQKAAFQNRNHFFAIAAKCMRRILSDYARRKAADKRRPPGGAITLDEAVVTTDDRFEIVLAVDEALEKLAERHSRQAQVVELRYYSGLTREEIAEVLGVSVATVKRDWEDARQWLERTLQSQMA
jgi:RNA polymerase sigma factor (TIGR02999 family)